MPWSLYNIWLFSPTKTNTNWCINKSKRLVTIIRMAERKWENNEPDVNMRVGFAECDWRFPSLKLIIQFSSYINRPKTPVEKALEFFHFDFEFSDEPSDTSLKQNYDVRIGTQLHLLQLPLGFQVFQVDKQYPDMLTELQNVADMTNNIWVK